MTARHYLVLIDEIIKSDDNSRIPIGHIFADGTYDGNEIFKFLPDN